ncbi:(2Fe-2S)-binding protein [Nitrogeniibacter mangrovi]|uniref:Bacterioferritin-associated ferredoxin n=1 Tax=Nitrogeniibacter mangrovi TaxID=2016596 RepID=A0A6C1AZP7_9RHOO|nr:(2Fe-2S)-binding protein [Nitrogeniibacter mangrovi]QID16841.1 (2Fe-2S)-binding protein [Nitrogeniibacter mangrovi]
MYVCVCNAVTERDIEHAARNGARRMRDLRGCLGVGADCGACACHAKACLDAATDQPGMDASFTLSMQEAAA